MIKISPKQIAWFIPIAYLMHLADEYFTGFPGWFSEVLNVSLSLNDFVIINSFGFTATIVIVTLYSFNKVPLFVISTLGVLFFINGIIHVVSTILTSSYSPGTATGLFIYFPLGYIIYKKVFPLLKDQQRTFSFVIAIVLQIIVALIAFNV